ncbi:uncharacterized protein FIBRA_00822 [Fibroporia radiculosa]|uniref:DUF6535 domain-containing protein n=1 Tax=Fibroporia radiculosa TaxID=599839 RepID=J4HS91_9APHY|nr:uncharacterized protein FIBRA_00822 [Fibroporia radiculosa]CCL98817.1 predicted protein [Fibroporia radiculosa]
MSSPGPNLASPSPALSEGDGTDFDLEAQVNSMYKSVESFAGNSTDVQSSAETRPPRSEAAPSLITPTGIQSQIRPGDKEADIDNKPSVSILGLEIQIALYVAMQMLKEASPINMVDESSKVQGQTASSKDVPNAVPDGDNNGGQKPNAESAPEQQPSQRKQKPENIIKEDLQGVWSDCANKLWGYQDEIIKRWKDELNNLLIFAGLFSAVLTAFVIEYYPKLQPSTTPNTTTQLLMIMSAQLEVLTAGARYNNSSLLSMSALASSSPASKPSSQVVAVNGLWFAALVFSLGAASLAISVNQWLNHHRTRPLSMSRESAEIWYLRHRSLDRWKVSLIISVLPVLLQVSLALFFVGLVVLLWPLNTSISAVMCVLVSLLLLGTIGSALIPAIVTDCAYKSPQAWWWLKLLCGLQKLISSAGLKLASRLCSRGQLVTDELQKISFRQWKASLGEWKAYLKQWKAPLKRLVGFLKQYKTSFRQWRTVRHDVDCDTVGWLYNIFKGWSELNQGLWNAGDWRACEVDSLTAIKENPSSVTPFQDQVFAEAYTMISDESLTFPLTMLCFDTDDCKTALNSLTALLERVQFRGSLGRMWGEYYARRASEEEKRHVIAMLDGLIDMLPMILSDAPGTEENLAAVNCYIRGLIVSMNDWRIVRDRPRKWWKSIVKASTTHKFHYMPWDSVFEVGLTFEAEFDNTDLDFLLSVFLSLQKGDFDRGDLLYHSWRFLKLARERKWLGLGSIRDDLRRLVAIIYDDLNAAVLLSPNSSTNILDLLEEYYFGNFIAEFTRHVKEKSGIFDVTGNMLAFFVDLACACDSVYEGDNIKEVGKIREYVDLPEETLRDLDVLRSSSRYERNARIERACARLRASCVLPSDIYVENGEASNS